MQNSNFLNRVWNAGLAENQVRANQVLPNEYDGANERYVQIIKLRNTLNEPRKISAKDISFTIDANNSL